MGSRSSDTNNRVVATNRRARHDYAIEETVEAGLVLVGSEVKSVRAGQVSMGDAYVDDVDGELYLVGVHIQEYQFAHRANHDPLRRRKLLLNEREIRRIRERINERGYTAVPLKFLLRKGWVKVEIGLGKGKKNYDRRQDIKARDAKRDMDRAMRR